MGSKYQREMQASYVAVNLYHLVPVDKAINVLIDTLNNDKEQLQEYAKSTWTAQINGTLSK